MNINYLEAFADWLSISYPSSLSPHAEILSFIHQISPMSYSEIGAGKELYKSESGGSCFVTTKETYTNVSISGDVLSTLRNTGAMREFESLLASVPHNITRLDIAYDVPIDGEISISNIQSLYDTGYVKLAGRFRQMNYNLSQIGKGRQTGTAYFQNKSYKGTVHLRVYDKAWEVLQRSGDTISPTTRYEVTIHRGASLRDFSSPSPAFWHFLPDGLLKSPESVSKWSACDRIDYDKHNASNVTDYERLRFVIQNSPALMHLIAKAYTVNGGSVLLEQEIRGLVSEYAAGMERSGDPAMSHVTSDSSTVLNA